MKIIKPLSPDYLYLFHCAVLICGRLAGLLTACFVAGMLRVYLGFVPLLILSRHAASDRKLPALTTTGA